MIVDRGNVRAKTRLTWELCRQNVKGGLTLHNVVTPFRKAEV